VEWNIDKYTARVEWNIYKYTASGGGWQMAGDVEGVEP
jgi:hypothetical protein